VGLPAFIRRDTSDDLLNPKTGGRSSLLVTPWTSIAGTDVTFVSARATHSLYRELDQNGRFVAAFYGAVGTILGPERETIPADKRLYAGGGGSVRGFGYQRIGPLAPNDRPLGGKSSLEFGVELRTMVTQSIGIVPFLEAGSVDESSVPKGRMFFGTGIGLRYYTPVGPVRLDVGVPLNPRPSDDAFQLYISLGQAF
jgi:translocation and assembly module TamA